MSWAIEEHIGEGRPWPAQVVVYRGETSESLAYVSGEVADRLKAENAQLREELAKWERLTAGISLPEYPVSQFVPKDLERENARLRELVRDMRKAFVHGACYRWCDHMPEPCNGGACQHVRRMRELGIEEEA